MAGIEGAKDGLLLYHLTQVDNFKSIVENGLMSRKSINDGGVCYCNIADMEIVDKRTELGLDKYIPFHFHPYSAFDVAVKNRYDAKRMMYMCISRKYAKDNDFKILPKHPLSEDECRLYDYDEGFKLIDWGTLTTRYINTDYAKEVKMAECLTDKRISITEFYQLFVPTQQVKAELIDIMNKCGVPESKQPHINVLPIWFNY